FPETLAYRDEIVRRFGLRLVELEPIMPRPEFAERYGLDLYARNPDLCCHINKVEPLKRYLPNMRAWINGRRRDQASTRTAIPIVEKHQDGPYKVNPLTTWTSKDTYYYLERHGIPTHPLFEQGYTSIGCAPCTRPPLAGGDERSGRWAGREKTECGLHTFLEPKAEYRATARRPRRARPSPPRSARARARRAAGRASGGRARHSAATPARRAASGPRRRAPRAARRSC